MILAAGVIFIALCSAISVCAGWHDPATGKKRPLWQRLTLLALAALEWL